MSQVPRKGSGLPAHPLLSLSVAWCSLFGLAYTQAANPSFIGYAQGQGGVYSELQCVDSGFEYFCRDVDGERFCDCATSDEWVVTACEQGTALNTFTEYPCPTTASVCRPIEIYDSIGADNPSTDFTCATAAGTNTYYRNLPAGASFRPFGPSDTIVVVPSTAAPETTTTTEPSDTSSTASTSASPTETSSAPPPPAAEEGGDSEESKAWIAGPVVGGVVVIAAIVGGVMFCRRRKKATPAQHSAAAQAPQGPQGPPGPQYYQGQQQYQQYQQQQPAMATMPPAAERYGFYERAELDTNTTALPGQFKKYPHEAGQRTELE